MPVMNRREFLCAAPLAAAAPKEGKAMRGVFLIVVTPYTPSLEVDYDALAREVDFLDRCGAHGIVWPQLTSEYASLKPEERRRGMEVLAKAVRGRRPALVLGVQGADRAEALMYTRHAETLAPDALIAIPPRRATALEEYRDYYAAIARATPKPVFVQTTGGAEGLSMPVEMIVSLAREHPNLGYVKEEEQPVVRRMQALAAHRPVIRSIFSGNGGRNMLYEMRLGMDGTMPAPALTDVYVRIWELYQSGRRAEARDIFSKLLLVLNAVQEIPGTVQYILHKRGVTKTILSREKKFELGPQQIDQIEFSLEPLRAVMPAVERIPG